jgi:putative peptidoglycan lipid II flippase
MVAVLFLVSGTSVVDQSIAAMLGSGSVSALNYGNKITALLTGVGSMALGTAVLPYFSRMVAVRDWSGIQHTLKTYTRLILLATIPLTLVLAYFSEPLVGLLFQRGAFTAADTRLVGQVQALYLLQIPCYVLSMLIVRLISSLKANSLLMWGAVISFFANVILDYVFALWLGVAGIALSTAVVVSISCCYLSYVLLRLMRRRALFEQG